MSCGLLAIGWVGFLPDEPVLVKNGLESKWFFRLCMLILQSCRFPIQWHHFAVVESLTRCSLLTT